MATTPQENNVRTAEVTYYNSLVQSASNAASPNDADALVRSAVLQNLETVHTLSEIGIVDQEYGQKALAMFKMFEGLSPESDSDSDEIDLEDDDEDTEDDEEELSELDEEELMGLDEEGAESDGHTSDPDEEEDDVAVRPHTRRYPAALVETVTVADLAPFKIFEPAWSQQLVTIFESRRIRPEKMVGLQVLLLGLFSDSHAAGAASLAQQWRHSKQHLDAWQAAKSAPATLDNPFPSFTRQMILCLKSEATEGLAEVFNLIEHVGVASRLANALLIMTNRNSLPYKAYVAWCEQQGNRSGRRNSYASIRKFIIQKAVKAVFSHLPGTTEAINLKLVNAMVRRADVLRALELAFGAGVFVLLMGFDWKSRTEKAWDERTEAVVLALSDDCPILRRVCRLAEKNIWSKVIEGDMLERPKLNAERWTAQERLNKDLLTLLSYEGEEINEVEELDLRVGS